MKKTYTIFAIFALILAVCTSCDSYLNRQPDDQLTSDNIFDKQTSTFKYLVNVYSFMPTFDAELGFGPEESSTDEGSCAFTGNRFFAVYAHNGLSPAYNDGYNYYRSRTYQTNYFGIREATYFMQNAHRCKELTEEQLKQYVAEARFLRAFFYYNLMRYYGPVIFIGDDMADFNDKSIADKDREPWENLVTWVCKELDTAAADLPDNWGSSYLGRATRGAAMAVKAKLLLYSARPLFNGQNGTGLYDNMVNNEGKKLFCTEYNEEKWKLAATAAKAVIESGLYELVNDTSIPVVQNYHNIFYNTNSPETIFCRMESASWRIYTMPAKLGTTNSYGGCSATQKLVDCFAMENGYYPITNIEEDNYNHGLGDIEIDPRSGYTEKGSSLLINPYWRYCPKNKPQTGAVNTMNMFVGREPRFYANICWSGQPYTAGNTVVGEVQFYRGGANGPGSFQNYSTTGYLPLKFNDPDKDGTNTTWGYVEWPIIRYADILLGYVEALNEYEPSNPDILKYWNMIRSRAGIPTIGTENGQVYSEIVGNQELQRKYIHRERMVELCFEYSRFYDCNTWMITDKVNNGDVAGCDINQNNHDIGGDYWKRTSIFNTFGEGGFMTQRTIGKKHYLLPFNQAEVDRCKQMTQNYGW